MNLDYSLKILVRIYSMGIYSDGNVYGISLVLNDIVLFQEKYQESLTGYQVEPVKECYNTVKYLN